LIHFYKRAYKMMATYGDPMSMAAMGHARWPGLTLRDLMGKVDQFPFLGGEDCKPGVKGEEEDWGPSPQAAFLGPQIWEKKLTMSALEEDGGWDNYSAQARFNSSQSGGSPDSGHNNNNNNNNTQQQQQRQVGKAENYHGYQQQAFPGLTPNFNQPMQQQHQALESDLALASIPGVDFDPKSRVFSPEELKPQPTIRKRCKTFTPPEKKDEKYWEKRGKNNIAARRSREARRLKENQIAMRAAYLEKQNLHLRVTLKNLNVENANIKVSLEALMARIKRKEAEIKNGGAQPRN